MQEKWSATLRGHLAGVARCFFPLVWQREEDEQYLLETAPFLGFEWPFSIWSFTF